MVGIDRHLGHPDGPPRPLSVVLADSHPVVRQGLRAVLEAEGISVVAVTSTRREAIREVLRNQPSVLLTGLPTTGTDATLMIRELRSAAPDTAILVFTRRDDDHSVSAALLAGVRGYLLQDAPPEAIVQAVRVVAAGSTIFGVQLSQRLPSLLSSATTSSHAFPGLTVRQREVLNLVAAGLSNTAIARTLDVATKTVSNHISAILNQLRVTDRFEAASVARAAGFGRADVPVQDRAELSPDGVDRTTAMAASPSTPTRRHSPQGRPR